MDPIYHTSSWEASSSHHAYPSIKHDLSCDVVIIGAGITGLTAALQLKNAGRKVIVVDAFQVGSGTTGGTSAHLSTLYDQDYRQLASSYGNDVTQRVARSMAMGIQLIFDTARTLDLDCELKRVPAYRFADRAQDVKAVEDEFVAARKAGVEVAAVGQVPLPFATEGGFRADFQGQFHPLKYLQGLAAAIHGDGSAVYEHSRVTDISEADGTCVVTTPFGAITAGKLIQATHTPLGINPVQVQLNAVRSYIMAFKSPQ